MATVRPSVDEIFNEAIRQSPGNDRAAYLEAICGNDTELRNRVERLLRAFADAGSFLESPAADMAATTDSPAIAERPGAVIGPYKLLQHIGEGGFGVVFLAEQERPVKRRVALKVIKPGMDTRQVIARFEAERQALAMMDHPNIAKVYDAGATEYGRPYFVMELVQGVPITEYCDRCNLTTRERLELFVTVCQAVQHAHQKGVIHRDIKPTNVLVAIQDSRPTPKIIDFGVAKAINQQLTEHTLMTAFAQMVGTPLYMSPEQAELSPLGVDTRSDIYSLGVLLYELLTGTTPFDKDRLHAASYDELRRIIREEEPPRPSTRISTLAADLATTAAVHRRTDARRLKQTVRGELDWIVMKCLEKDRNRRYETPNSLARDIERYLRDEPVQACPPSIPYRLKKFVRRNKIAAAFVLLLVGAVAALSVSNVQTRRSEQRATTENAKALAVSNLLQGMLRSANPDEAKDAEYTVRQLLDDFSTSFGGGLDDQPEVEAEIRATIGRAYWRLGVADKAEPHLTKALELRRASSGPDSESVAEVLVDMAWCRNEQGRLSDAVDAVREALRIYRSHGTTGSPALQASMVLQRVLISSQQSDEAQSVAEEALAQARASGKEYPEIAVILHGQADLYVQLGRFREAELVARQAVDLHRRLHGPAHPETAWGLLTLGNTLRMQQKLVEAEDALREALAIFRQRYRGEHHSLTSTLNSLKDVLNGQGDKSGLEALAKQEAEIAMRSAIPDQHFRLAELLMPNKSTDSARTAEAHRQIQRAMDAYGQVAVDFPNELDHRLKAVDGFVELAKLCTGDPAFAEEFDEVHRRLVAELEALPTSFPDSAHCQEQVAHCYRKWAFTVAYNRKYVPQYEHAHRQAIRLFEKLLHANPNLSVVWFCLADSYDWLGDVQRCTGKSADAAVAYRRALEIYDQHAEEIVKDSAQNAWEMTYDYFRYIRYGLLREGNRPSDTQQDQAHDFIRRVIDEFGQVAERYPGDLDRRVNALTGYLRAIGHCAATPGFAGEVDELNRRLEVDLPKLVADFPDSADCQWHAANLYRQWAVQLILYRDYLATAERALNESIKFHEKVSLSNPKRPGAWLYLADRNIVLGYVNWLTGRPEDAEAAYRRAIDIFNQHEAEEIAADNSDNVANVINIDSVWLAYYLGCTQREDQAAEFIRKAALNAQRLTDPFQSALALYFTALVQIRLGDEAGYRETCKALVDAPFASADDMNKARTILTWCHAPGALEDLSLSVQRAEELAAHNSIDPPHIVPYILGAALYRAGQYERAAVELEKSIAAYPSEPQLGDRIINWQRLFLAMTKWQLDQRDEARQLLSEIQPAIDEELQSLSTPFNYRLTLEVLQREAAALIGSKVEDETIENGKPNKSAPTTDD